MRFASAFDWFKYPPAEAVADPYTILGISRWTPNEDVKRAWRKAMVANHPDLGGSPQRTVELNEAYHIIRKKRGF